MILVGAAWIVYGAVSLEPPSLAAGAVAVVAGAVLFRRGNRAHQEAIRLIDDEQLAAGTGKAARAEVWQSALPQLPTQIGRQGRMRYTVRLGPTMDAARGDSQDYAAAEIVVLADKRADMWVRLCQVLGGDQRRLRQRGLLNVRDAQEIWIGDRPVYAAIHAEARSGS